MNTKKHALILLAPGFEELEAITISDLLVRAGINVITAGLTDDPVTASRGTTVITSTTIDAVEDDLFDILILPGGLPGADNLRDNKKVQKIIKFYAEQKRYIAAICAAPKALAEAGIINDKIVTCYPGALDNCKQQPKKISNAAIEVDGNILTSRGPGTAIDFALLIIETLLNKEISKTVEAQLVRN